MKKILAGVLATASLMAMTVSASATTKNVTTTGDISYEVNATAPKIVLKLTMPAKLEASLNPFGADIKLTKAEDAPTLSTGIASVAYDVINKSVEYGVYLSGTAITKVVTTDVDATTKKSNWEVSTAAVKTDGSKKSAQMALMVAADADALAALTAPTPATGTCGAAATDDDTQGYLCMDSTVAAAGDVKAGQTSQAKFAYIPAAADANTPSQVVLGFVGDLASGTNSSTKKEITWYDDDAINVNLVIKVTAGPKTLITSP